MTKVCIVCGYSTENVKLRECPNCGSYDFKTVEDQEKRGSPLRRFKSTTLNSRLK